jgi:hypothetical protein
MRFWEKTMTAPSLLIVLASLLQSVSNDKDHSAPPEAMKATYVISDKAQALIGPLDARTLADDEAFIKMLMGVLKNPDFTDADKADAFFLMRMKFDWAFIGAASIPPGFTYDRVFGMYIQTYRGHRKALGNGHDVKGLLELANLSGPEHIARASSALLLAAVLNPQATRDTVVALCEPQLVAASAAPPIAIHHLALCAALCDVGAEGFTRLAALTSRFPFEESQEDVVLALAYSDSARTRELIQQFAEQHAPKKFDLAVQLALTIVRARQTPQEFQAWIQPLAATAESEECKKSILDWAAGKPKPIGPSHPRQGATKIWDGFEAIIYDDGVRLKFGDKFSGFMSRE